MSEFSIAADFSATPGPRFRKEGPNSGEELLEILKPLFKNALTSGAPLLVDLDGTAGYATSFLEATFGGLAREFGSEAVLDNMTLKSEEEPYLLDEIDTYVREASAEEA